MLRSLKAALIFSSALVAGSFLGATAVSPVHADALAPAGAAAHPVSEAYVPLDPNKKKPGEECKSSDECQKHHTCTKSGDKSVCVAPPRPKLPPGAVT